MADDYVITFDPVGWGAIRERLRTVAPPGAPAARAPAGFTDAKADLPTGTRVYPTMGIGVVDSAEVDLARLARMPGVIVRRARAFRRPPTDYAPVPAALAAPPPGGPADLALGPAAAKLTAGAAEKLTAAMWMDTPALAWTLQSIGVDASDDEGEAVLVGVIDSGVDLAHPDIAACVGRAVSPIAGLDGKNDLLGHGTHVIGVIAGSKTPARGGPRYGIAPRARVNSYRIYDQHETTTEAAVICAIHMAVDDGCRVIALATGTDGGDAYVASDAELGNYVAAHGAMLLAAAGNESNRKLGEIAPTNAPANAPRIDAVGAADRFDALWNSSNGTATDAARRVDWLAPGVSVRSALRNTPGDTVAATGTSAATAVAAGVAAAIWSRNPNWTADAVRAALGQFARSVSGPAGAVGDGRIRVR